MKEINSINIPQHGEVFYFYCQALIRFSLFQELSSQVTSIACLSVVALVLSVVLALALLPAAPEWEALALAGSVLVTVCVGTGTLAATQYAPLPLFALILVSLRHRMTAGWSSGLRWSAKPEVLGSNPGSGGVFVMNNYTCSRVMAVYILL
jgi:hypothetical protein